MPQATGLSYLTQPDMLELSADLLVARSDGNQQILILDRTPFYPQGGGQPSDVGLIAGADFVVRVDRARLDRDGVVSHWGTATGVVRAGPVVARVDYAQRARNSRLHSAGHLIMSAMFELTGMRAMKGYHFPEGAYVEFESVLSETDRASLGSRLQGRIDEMVAADDPVTVESVTQQQLETLEVFIPSAIPSEKPMRLVRTFGYNSPCGGTHVGKTGELCGLCVKAIKTKAGRTRVSYEFTAGS